jgi:hypothetical protein
MDITIINMTFLKVNGELEQFSTHIYPNSTYQKILRNPQLREKLLAFVLSRIPNHYVAFSADKIISISPESLNDNHSQRQELKKLIQQGVVHLILSEINTTSPFAEQNTV